MKLLTKAIEKTLPALYATDGQKEKKVQVKFFTPFSNWTWYVFEGEKQEDGDYLFFGLVEGHETEMGYFTLSELSSSGLVERDRYFSGVYNTETGQIQ